MKLFLHVFILLRLFVSSSSDQDKIICDFIAATNVGSILQTGWKCNRNRPVGAICHKDKSNWPDIMCDKNGYITRIAIRYKSLTGTLPSSLGDLTHLTYLSFFRNHLTGKF
jgi:hypothetical protein